ncbi:Mut7-C RNAse domain-containing protein [Actinacidiphila sp. bgisy160]|uniref:Mut7-C RNAse domain-containing protein n=1 Tax=Actinacidiphila sp. bgisy160 TaxID=3413796 RepID=UPI003D7075BB
MSGDGPGRTPRSRLRLRFAAELGTFLSAPRRGREVRVAADGVSTLGHVVQSLGVPLTEVGAMAADGRPAGPAYRPRGGELVEVAAATRPQPAAARYLLDVHLGKLARRMRILGLDTAYGNDLDDATLVARANAEGRVLLTRDRGLLARRALRRGAYVRGDRADEQLADVLDRFAPPLAPWTRCTACNGVLAPVAKDEIAHLLQPGTRRTQDAFARCADCARIYWPGAHHGRLDALVAQALSRATGWDGSRSR